MTRESLVTLNSDTLIGYTAKRGRAWHYRAGLQGAESNHYEGAIPTDDVYRRLFSWTPVAGELQGVILGEDGVQVMTDPTRQVIIRPDTNTVLGVFSKGYRIHDYRRWLVDNVESILDSGELAIGSAGLLRGGAVAWVQIEMEDTLSVEGIDYRPFLTAATSLDGSLATTYQTGVQVVVCDNTLSAAMREGDTAARVKIRHSVKSLTRLAEVREALGIVHGVGDAFAQAVRELCEEHVSDARWAAFVDAYTGRNDATNSKRSATNATAKAAALQRLWHYDERVSPWSGTAYGVVAAVNTYTHHEAEVRGAGRTVRNAERMVTGGVEKLDAETLRILATV